MKDANHKIDDLFRRSFEGYTVEPSSSVWNGIVQKYFATGLLKSGLLSIQNIVSSIIIVGAGISINYVFPTDNSQESVEILSIANNTIPNNISTIQTTDNISSINSNNPSKLPVINASTESGLSEKESDEDILKKTEGALITSLAITKAPIKQPAVNPYINENKQNPDIASESSFSDQSDYTITTSNIMSYPLILERNKDIAFVSTDQLSTGNSTNTDLFKNTSNPQSGENKMGAKYNNIIKISKRERDYFKKSHISYRNKYSQVPVQWNNDYLYRSPWALGLLITPEWIYYPGDSIVRKNSYSIELAAIYQKDQFILRSGIGVAVSNDNGNFVINWETNDSTGFYYGINSFEIDAENPDSPIFDTFVETVYDSVAHASHAYPDNQYTYLQIPLLVGYKVLDVNRFSCSLMGGPVLSLLIHEDEKTVGFSDIDATLINIENNTPKRLNTSWQFMFSAGFNYRISNSLSLTLEPTYKYYIRSVYEQRIAGTKNPWSIGLRGGIIYTF